MGRLEPGVERGTPVDPAAPIDLPALQGPPDVVREMMRLQQQRIFVPPPKPLPAGQHLDPIRIDLATLRTLAPGAAGRVLGQSTPAA